MHLRLAGAALLALAMACAPAPPSHPSPAVPVRPGRAVLDTGTVAGAPYLVEIPADWNGGLVMYTHGYETVGTPFEPHAPRHAGFRQAFTSRGFAFAQSWYRAQGWAVREALDDTEALRRHFIARYGRPDSTFITGHSMGGLITVAIIEQRAAEYDGALPFCPILAPAAEWMRHAFDLLVAFDYLFPGALTSAPGGVGELRSGPVPAREPIAAAARGNPEAVEALAKGFSVRPQNVPGLVWFYAVIVRELQERAGGNPFDNRGTAYHGLGDDAAFNRGVRRYAADASAVAYLNAWYTPTGRIADPVLAVQTTYDPVVAPQQMDRYRITAQLAETADRYAASFVVADGHCAFTPAQVGAAFDRLRTWAATGQRPPEGEIVAQ